MQQCRIPFSARKLPFMSGHEVDKRKSRSESVSLRRKHLLFAWLQVSQMHFKQYKDFYAAYCEALAIERNGGGKALSVDEAIKRLTAEISGKRDLVIYMSNGRAFCDLLEYREISRDESGDIRFQCIIPRLDFLGRIKWDRKVITLTFATRLQGLMERNKRQLVSTADFEDFDSYCKFICDARWNFERMCGIVLDINPIAKYHGWGRWSCVVLQHLLGKGKHSQVNNSGKGLEEFGAYLQDIVVSK